eukprot:CAMPEP_0172460448 /NCGR_PEP_ID=MMETSP1065-20121228/36916_1 /TAXON_ID=265537 /ORGANISM="Amphiprora paludosa, Strain CCMP125" /LENGTH=419 /DNA_ID=CAMNT_0013215471 /DNA_START=80 /DNA_END=1339 /DNA_ORIENTATION=+
MWTGLWRPPVQKVDTVRVTTLRAALRWFIVYVLGMAAVNLWRGVWYLTDYHLLPDTLTDNGEGEWPLASFWTSSVVGSSFCFMVCCGASLLAPPAIFLLDGPGVNSPPLAVTALSTYYSLTQPAGTPEVPVPWYWIAGDILLSFFAVPIMVVWFWRGSWLLMDYYLWGFSLSDQDVHHSIGWSFLIGVVLIFLTSETVFAQIKVRNEILDGALNRLRTYLLAWGTVNYWRMVWYIWDEFLGDPTYWSCWLAHWGSLAVLTALGCVSCIVAPASTLGMDLKPHPKAADEPLFSNVPVPAEDLVPLAIGRQPPVVQANMVPKETVKQMESYIASSVMASVAQDPETAASVKTSSKQAWAKSGTGSRPGYSSARTETESARQGYVSVQRPDWDRRVGSSELMLALSTAGVSVRGSSSHFRSR